MRDLGGSVIVIICTGRAGGLIVARATPLTLAPMNDSSVLMEQLVRIADVLDWSADDASSYNMAIAILKEMTGAVLAPTFLLDASATELVLLGDDEFSRLPSDFATMPAWMHIRPPWVNGQEWPVSARDHHQ